MIAQTLSRETVIKIYQIRLLREELDQKLKFFHIIQRVEEHKKEEPVTVANRIINTR
jgi:hypothetical protein